MSTLSAHFPERQSTIVLLRRGAIIWCLGRLLLAMLTVMAAAGPTPRPFDLGIPATLGFVVLVGGLGMLDTYRMNEQRFLANLGVAPVIVAFLLTIPALAVECVVGLVRVL